MVKYDIVIIGAGASGLMCAMRAGQRGRKVVVIDHADQVGSKILISGGGRCNFTNTNTSADRYISNNPHFCLSALKGFTSRDFVALVAAHSIPYHEKTAGQLFCDNTAQDIVDMLMSECNKAGVVIRLGEDITNIAQKENFIIETDKECYEAASLVMATGGLAVPTMGATDLAHQMARYFGLEVIPARPGLVPLVFTGEILALMKSIAGVAVDVSVTCGRKSFRENMLFTHKGLSGPAILQISTFWREGEPISIDMMPERDAVEFLIERKKAKPKTSLKNILAEILPQRLAVAIVGTYFADSPAIGDMTNKALGDVAALIKGWKVTPTGTEGFAKAEITFGGVDTHELSSKTMESNKVKGLYFIGEAVDVTGWLGGYNFQWAWSSGWAAGSAA